MTTRIDHTGAFASFWNREFPDLPCPPLPKKESDLTMTARETLRISDPVLFQNLFATGAASLPADVANRRNLGQNVPADAAALQAAGLQWEADELRRRAEIAEAQQMNQRIDESRQLQALQQQRTREWQSMGLLQRLGHTPIDPAVAARNREKWGITGS